MHCSFALEELRSFCQEFRKECPFNATNAISGDYDKSYERHRQH